MNTENIVKNLRALWRSDRIIAEIRLRHMLVGLGMRAFAALIAAFGLLMMELAAYFALIQIWNAIIAAVTLGLVNFAIATLLFLLSGREPSGRDLELAQDVHGSAMAALQAEARAAQGQVTGLMQHPLQNALLPLAAPLIAIILKSLRRSRATPARSEESKT